MTIKRLLGSMLATSVFVSCSTTSPLHKAAIQGNVAEIEYYLNKDISVNAVDKKGNTPLHYAYYYGHQDVIDRLVEFGADMNVQNKDGDTPRDMLRIAAAERLVASGATSLNRDAAWTNTDKGRSIYNKLRSMDGIIVTKAVVRRVLAGENRLRVLFLAVKLGIPGSESQLIDILNAYGDKKMAEDYLNAGSQALYEGARQWASNHGYYISNGMGSHRVLWGQF